MAPNLRRSRTLRRWVAQAGALAALAGAMSFSAAAVPGVASAAAATPCPHVVTGASFNYKAVGGKQLAGRTYQVLVISESCAAAGTWVSKLTRDSRGSRTADGGYAIAGGPTGWKCEGGGYPAVTHSAPTISGECYVGSLFSPTKYFYWKPSVS